METKTLECGCKVPIVNGRIKLDLNNLDSTCHKTWDLLATGAVKGIFQFESSLGKQFIKKLKPTHLSHLAGLTSALRPGCLKFLDEDGVSVTEHYCLRKNGVESVKYLHPALEPILKDTFGLILYQEQLLRIAIKLAGFSLGEADSLRKSIAKKLPELMAKLKIQFLAGCKKIGILDEQQANEIFHQIQKSARYLFNSSHSYSYSLISLQTAYLKSHFKLEFYTAYLEFAREKMKPLIERADLIDDAKHLDVVVQGPDISKGNIEFKVFDGVIYYGLGSIKGVGPSQIAKLKEFPTEWWKVGWINFLINLSDNLSSTSVERFIETGAFSCFKLPRQELLYQYQKYNQIAATKKEYLQRKYQAGKINSLTEAVQLLTKSKKDGGEICTAKDVVKYEALYNSLLAPPYKNIDTVDWISWCEKEFLGIPLTCNEIDSYDLARATCTCIEYIKGYEGYTVIGAEVTRVVEYEIKKGDSKGKKMAFVAFKDGTATIDNGVCFADTWETAKDVLAVGKTLLIQGERSKKDSFQIQKVSEI